MEKSGGMRPGGGATYPGIPPMEVLRLVTPLEEEVSSYPGVCSTIWLHNMGGGKPAERLPYTYSKVSGYNSGDKTLLL